MQAMGRYMETRRRIRLPFPSVRKNIFRSGRDTYCRRWVANSRPRDDPDSPSPRCGFRGKCADTRPRERAFEQGAGVAPHQRMVKTRVWCVGARPRERARHAAGGVAPALILSGYYCLRTQGVGIPHRGRTRFPEGVNPLATTTYEHYKSSRVVVALAASKVERRRLARRRFQRHDQTPVPAGIVRPEHFA